MEPRIGFLNMGPLDWEFGTLIIRLLLLEDGYFLHDNFFTVILPYHTNNNWLFIQNLFSLFQDNAKHVKYDKNVPLIHIINNQRIY